MRFALKCKAVFPFRARVFVYSTLKAFVVYLKVGLENLRKTMETMGKKVCVKLNLT